MKTRVSSRVSILLGPQLLRSRRSLLSFAVEILVTFATVIVFILFPFAVRISLLFHVREVENGNVAISRALESYLSTCRAIQTKPCHNGGYLRSAVRSDYS